MTESAHRTLAIHQVAGMKKRIWQCETEPEHVAWTVSALLRGKRVHDTQLWLGGVQRPVRVVGQAKAALRAQGVNVRSAMESVIDAEGEAHQELCWRVDTAGRVMPFPLDCDKDSDITMTGL